MQENNLSESSIKLFSYYYTKLLNSDYGILKDREIFPIDNLKNYLDIKENSNNSYIKELALIKLNGGLGTSMGLGKAKSLIKIKDNYSFLDIIVQQVFFLRKTYNIKIPLLFMNSYNTQKDTLTYLLDKYKDLKVNSLPLNLLQNKYPRINKEDFSPYKNIDDKLTWNPPGHGEIYNLLYINKLLDVFQDNKINYLFVSNSDNLNAVYDSKLLNYFVENDFSIMMEVCQRNERDKKGGHLSYDKNKKFILREIAQTSQEELDDFQNIEKYKYFNTNNLWINLKKLRKYFQENAFLKLPMIVNEKQINGQKFLQIESAMGSIINLFEDANIILVPRSRFLPIKKINDLFLLWSDVFSLQEDFTLKQETKTLPVINLSEKYYKDLSSLKRKIKNLASLKKCLSLNVLKNHIFTDKDNFIGNIEIK